MHAAAQPLYVLRASLACSCLSVTGSWLQLDTGQYRRSETARDMTQSVRFDGSKDARHLRNKIYESTNGINPSQRLGSILVSSGVVASLF